MHRFHPLSVRIIHLAIAWPGAVCLPHVVAAQSSIREQQIVSRGPQFLQSEEGDTSGLARPVKPETVEALRRPVTLAMTNVPLSEVLRDIARQTGVQFTYSETIAATQRPVSLHVDQVSLATTLYDLLRHTNLDIWVTASGTISLVPRATMTDAAIPDQFAVIVGTVMDRANGAPLELATVALIDSTSGRREASRQTGLDGRFRFEKVPLGKFRLDVRRLGYVPALRFVSIADTSLIRQDVALVKSPLSMDQIVITRTGDESQRSIGNYVSTIPADSVAALQPVQQLSDVLNARAAGVQVFSGGGLSGQAPQITIRGQNSATLSNQPIMYIDGTRVDNGYGLDQKTGRYNDIPADEIESIQVVRGPSAAALYGTDAATGIILITTKKGVAGAPRWSLLAENGLLTMDRDRFKESYFSWGHPPGGGAEGQCTVQAMGADQCVIDSVTTYTPMRDPEQTPIGTGSRQNYLGQVSGGSPTVRYFTSAGAELEVGYLKLPQAERADVASLPGGLTAVADPNAVQKVSVRQSVSAEVSSTADLSVAGGYIDNRNRIPTDQAVGGGQSGPGYAGAPDIWGNSQSPASFFESRVLDHAQHLTVSGTGNWRPSSVFSAHATIGIDHSNDAYDALNYAGQGPTYLGGVGTDQQTAMSSDVYTVDVGASASTPLGRYISTKTSIGSEYTRHDAGEVVATGSPLVPACGTVSCAAATTSYSNPTEVAVIGGYFEEQLSANDALIIAGGGRVDGSSTFGSSYRAAFYPKASGSWLASAEPFWPRQQLLNSLRLRAGYGESGTQPTPQQAMTLYQYQQTFVDGQPSLGAYPYQIGNPHLQPERQREYEGGVDADVLFGRIHNEFTYYDKLSSQALVTIQLGSSVGAPQETENVGSVRNQGIEDALTVTAIDARAIRLDLGVNASLNRNELVALGKGVQPEINGFGEGSLVPGRPLFAIFDHPYKIQDLNHNGMLEANELTIDSSESYLGSSYPRSQLTFTATVSGLRGHIRLNAQVDHRDGFVEFNTGEAARCYFGYCRAEANVHSSLSDQAAALAWSDAFVSTGYENNGSFTRLREVALTFVLPDKIAHAMRARNVEITLAGRNLALWTRYPGVDPEGFSTTQLPNQANSNGAYQDIDGSVPPATYWIVRLHLSL